MKATRRIMFPFGGLNKTAGYDALPPNQTHTALNVRPFDSLEGRMRGGRRPGLSKWLNVQPVGTGSIQALTRAVRSASYGDTFRDQVLLSGVRASSVSARVLDNNGSSQLTYDTGDSVLGAARDNVGNYYVSGNRSTTWAGNDGSNATVWKLDGVGDVVWTYDTGDQASEIFYSAANDVIIVAGDRSNTWTDATGSRSLWVLDADDGSLLWSYDTGDDLHSCTVDSDGNVYVAGNRSSGNTVWKLDADGNLLADFDTGSGANRADSIALSNTGAVAVSQRLATTDWEGNDASSKNIWVLNSALSSVTASYLKLATDEMSGIAQNIDWDPDGNLVVSGPRTSNLTTVKFSPDGTNIWTFDGGDDSDAVSIDSNGDVVIGMARNNAWTGSSSANASAIKLASSNGAVVWSFDTGDRVIEVFVYRDAGQAATTRESSLAVVAEGTVKKIVGDAVSTPTGGASAMSSDYGFVQLTNAYNKVFMVDGTNSKVFDLAANTVTNWASDVTDGTLQANGRLLALYRGRLVISGVVTDPHNYFMSRVGDPFDFDYSPTTTTQLDAVAGNNSQVGLVGDVITALIPFGDDALIFGGDSSIYQLTGDPAAGGTIDMISDTTGIAFGKAWAKDPSNTLYFLGVDGVYRMRLGEAPESITTGRLDRIFEAIDLASNRAVLEWDFIRKQLWVVITPLSNEGEVVVYVWDQRTDSWWQDMYPEVMGPAVLYGYDAEQAEDRAFLFGCRDGYIRYVDESNARDDTSFVLNYVRFRPIIDDDPSSDTRISSITAVLGEADGFASLRVYTGQTAEQAAKSTEIKFQTDLGSGRSKTIRPRVSGNSIELELYQLGSGDFWALERLSAVTTTVGRSRRRSQ